MLFVYFNYVLALGIFMTKNMINKKYIKGVWKCRNESYNKSKKEIGFSRPHDFG